MANDELIVKLTSDNPNRILRLYCDDKNLVLQNYVPMKNKWVSANLNPDSVFDNIGVDFDDICNFGNILDRFNTEYHAKALQYPGHKFASLLLLYRHHDFYQLYDTAPALGALVIRAYAEQKLSYEEARIAPYMKRHELLETLHLPSEKYHARIWPKIKPNGKLISEDLLNYGARFTECELAIKAFHAFKFDSLDEILLRTLVTFRRELQFPFMQYSLNTFGNRADSDLFRMAVVRNDSLVRHATNCARALGIINPEKHYMKIKKMDKFMFLFEKWRYELNEKMGLVNSKSIFPEPPVPGNNNIIPITTYKELCEEGSKMMHCASQYGVRMLDGQYYVYKMHNPERCTIGINISRDNKLCLEQIRLFNNKVPSNDTIDKVAEWFYGNNTDKYPIQRKTASVNSIA